MPAKDALSEGADMCLSERDVRWVGLGIALAGCYYITSKTRIMELPGDCVESRMLLVIDPPPPDVIPMASKIPAVVTFQRRAISVTKFRDGNWITFAAYDDVNDILYIREGSSYI